MGTDRFAPLIAVALAVSLGAGSAAAQQSLHEQPIGTTVERSFVLAGKTVPLPEGKFKLAYAGEYTGTLLPGARTRSSPPKTAQVVLYKSDGPKLQALVRANANLGTAARWSIEPCKRNDFLYRVDRAQTTDWIVNCFTLDHQLGLLNNPSGIWVAVHDVLRQEGVQIPLQFALHASFTRTFHEEYLAVNFYINPGYYGLAADPGPNWATSPWHVSRIESNPDKAAFVRAVAAWGNGMLSLVGEGFEGKTPSAAAPPMEFPRSQSKASAN